MGIEELTYIILKLLKNDDDNGTNEFFKNINPLIRKVGELKIARVINELLDKGLANGSKQYIGAKGEVGFCESVSITLDGVKYLKNNSKGAKIFKAIKEVKDSIPGL